MERESGKKWPKANFQEFRAKLASAFFVSVLLTC